MQKILFFVLSLALFSCNGATEQNTTQTRIAVKDTTTTIESVKEQPAKPEPQEQRKNVMEYYQAVKTTFSDRLSLAQVRRKVDNKLFGRV